MVSEKEAISIARRLLFERIGKDLYCYGAKFIDAKEMQAIIDNNNLKADELPDDLRPHSHWAVSFELKDADGGVIDGPLMIDVDSDSGVAKFLDSL